MARAAAILKRLAVLLLLLALPAVALSSPLPKTYWPALCIWAALLSLLAFFVVRSDKHKASAGQWRTPESTLHMLELLGGWPGSFLAQRQYRHKVSKTSYQIVFWLIVLLYQLAALDSIQGWPWAHALLAQSGLVTR